MHGREQKCIKSFGRKPEGKRSWEDLCVDGRIIKWILKNRMGRHGLDSSSSE
jgi:hypothetical protein